jgi:hypothetical protein
LIPRSIVRTPYPRSAGFDTDIGAFIESSTVGHQGSMAHLLISDGIRSGDIFVPGQLFAFGSIMLHADPTGHLDQVDSFTPDQEIRFGNLEFIADSRGDLILTGSSTSLEGPANLEASTSSTANPTTGTTATADPASGPDLTPMLGYQGSASVEHDCIADPVTTILWVDPVNCHNLEPTDLLLLNGILDRIQALGISDGQSSVYDQIGLKTDDSKIRTPLATHLVATIKGSTKGSPLPPEQEAHGAQVPDQQASPSSSAAKPRSGEGLEPKSSSARNLESAHSSSANFSDLELGALDSMPIQDAAAKNPDSHSAGIKFLIPPTPHIVYCPDNSGRPDLWDLMYIKQQPGETVRHFWARFLIIKNKMMDGCSKEILEVFRQNCRDEGVLNALARRRIQSFSDLSDLVSKYCDMEYAWQAQLEQTESIRKEGSNRARAKRTHPRRTPPYEPPKKRMKSLTGSRIVLDELLDKPRPIHSVLLNTNPTHRLRACWVVHTQINDQQRPLMTTPRS